MLSDEGWLPLRKTLLGGLGDEREGRIGFFHHIGNGLSARNCVSSPSDILDQTASLVEELHSFIVSGVLSNQIVNCLLVVFLLLQGVHGVSSSFFYFEHRGLCRVKLRLATTGLGVSKRFGNGAGPSIVGNDGGLVLEAADDRGDARSVGRSSCYMGGNALRVVAPGMGLSPVAKGLLVNFGETGRGLAVGILLGGVGVGVGLEEVGVVVVVGGELLFSYSLLPASVLRSK